MLNLEYKFSALIWLILFICLQSCANSKIGQELSKSFNEAAQISSDTEQQKRETLNKNISVKQKLDGKKKTFKTESSSFEPKKSKDKAKKISYTPRPYRITIKLSAANPSAPAETVTKALRKAGISFEVEMIKRVESDKSSKAFPIESRSRRL